jgi:hypothetical protein
MFEPQNFECIVLILASRVIYICTNKEPQVSMAKGRKTAKYPLWGIYTIRQVFVKNVLYGI